ncbi:hypothetical protein JCM19037_4834 [Geomicrobium sp. JCM 19037]|uniref:hypothetical protein n=1 Tax=unclassified Geomicrobium TaxID=2628951 RepID=UPI00045F19CD|nr:hypothetical protein [Geomicrobium sp. JCM 19037]GAK06250.1 hypothetical protein JCM19037_4834 [Geomicrobium sp. JCM 19037]
MKTILEFLRLSIRLPEKQAVFTLNREGFGLPIVFLCFILFIVSIPLGLQMVLSGENMAAELALPIFFVYFTFLYYPFFVLTILTPLVFITLFLMMYARIVKRKMGFFMLYKISAFASIIPVIGLSIMILTTVDWLQTVWIVISIVYILFVMIRVVHLYPPKRTTK